MKKSLLIPTTLLGLALATAGCGSNRNIVDGKAELTVPNSPSGTICYLLEINIENSGGGEVGEEYRCVVREEWLKNRVGDDWVDASGKAK